MTFLLLGVGACSSGGTTDGAPAYLMVQHAASGTWADRDGTVTLTLRGVAPTTVQFSDRPARDVRVVPTGEFVAGWDGLFGDDPPNAAVVLAAADDRRDTVVVELADPTFDASTSTLAYQVRVLQDVDAAGVEAADAVAALPSSFADVSVFIDNATGLPTTDQRAGTDRSASSPASGSLELSTYYTTWNPHGLAALQAGTVPLDLASRYNVAFAAFVPGPDGPTVAFPDDSYGPQIIDELRTGAPTAAIYVTVGDAGMVDCIADDRCAPNIAQHLVDQGLHGIEIDAEDLTVMRNVPALVSQLGPAFRPKGLKISVSVPWNAPPTPAGFGADAGCIVDYVAFGPCLYGDDPAAVLATFAANVDAIELQTYSVANAPPNPDKIAVDASAWVHPGSPVTFARLVGGISSEPGKYQTADSDIEAWTQFAADNGMQGMFSWRLDNDHTDPTKGEGIDPTYAGARALHAAAG